MNERERFEAWFHREAGRKYDCNDARDWWALLGWQAALADRPEPAQPVATVVDAPMCRANTSWVIDVQLPVGTKLYAATPSHPAPSEAAPERQEQP